MKYLAILMIVCAARTAVAQTTQPARIVNLLAMGDWGSGNDNQKAVARALAEFAVKQTPPVSAMLLAGDNFYNDLKGIDDPEWQNRFENLYDPAAMNFPFYAALGNHDYEHDEAPIQLAYSKAHPQSRFKLPARWYRVEFPPENPLVTVLMLDSNKPLMGEDQWNRQKRWMIEQLSAPRQSKWIIAVAHHPLFSNGAHGDNGELQKEWGALFSEFGLSLYICGHDHDLQHLEIPGYPVSLVVSGGGGANIRPMAVDNRGPFSKMTFGFAALYFTEDQIRVRLVDGDQQVLHEFVRDRDGNIKVTAASQSDTAVPRTPRSVAGGDDSARKSPATSAR